MARQIVIIGLGGFGRRMLERLSDANADVIIIDKNAEVIERFKDLARQALIADALNEKALERLVPPQADAAIVDMGSSIEASILVTNHLKRLGIREIIVKTDTEERGDILTMVGATRIVYPDREAANQVAPVLASAALFAFMPIGPNLALGEVLVPSEAVGKTLVEADLRKERNVNVVAIRKGSADDYSYFDPMYRLDQEDILLVAGNEDDIFALSGTKEPQRKRSLSKLIRGMFTGAAGAQKGKIDDSAQ